MSSGEAVSNMEAFDRFDPRSGQTTVNGRCISIRASMLLPGTELAWRGPAQPKSSCFVLRVKKVENRRYKHHLSFKSEEDQYISIVEMAVPVAWRLMSCFGNRFCFVHRGAATAWGSDVKPSSFFVVGG